MQEHKCKSQSHKGKLPQDAHIFKITTICVSAETVKN